MNDNLAVEIIPFIGSPISYSEFARQFLVPARPCIFGKWITREWNGRKDFTRAGDGGVDVERLRQVYGDCTADVADVSAPTYGYDSSKSMRFSDFLDTWLSGQCLYLKDFHFARDAPWYKVYEVPVLFQSDWMNEYWDRRAIDDGCPRDDFRFIYAGPAGTWTPLHCDVIRSHSWSANLVGVKRWILFPPGEMLKVEPFVREKQEPSLDKIVSIASQVGARFADIYQKPGEIIFVPSEWGHQVRNETDVVSLNHNWFNGFNVATCFKYLETEWNQTQSELAAFGVDNSEDLSEQTERIVASSAGCGLRTFVDLIETIVKIRLEQFSPEDVAENKVLLSVDGILQAKEINPPGSAQHAVIDLLYVKSLIESKLLTFSGLVSLDKKLSEILHDLLCKINNAFVLKN